MARETIERFLFGSNSDSVVDDDVSGYHLFASVVSLPVIGVTAAHGKIFPLSMWVLVLVQNVLLIEWDQHSERYEFGIIGMIVKVVTQLAIMVGLFLLLLYSNGVIA